MVGLWASDIRAGTLKGVSPRETYPRLLHGGEAVVEWVEEGEQAANELSRFDGLLESFRVKQRPLDQVRDDIETPLGMVLVEKNARVDKHPLEHLVVDLQTLPQFHILYTKQRILSRI